MSESIRYRQHGPLPWLLLGAVIGVAMFGMHGIGAIVLTLVGVGFAAKWMYRWHMANGGAPLPAGWGAPTGWASCAGGWKRDRRAPAEPPSSGNHAFDDYRREMLRRLEQDHQDFQSFLDRLRRAKDKAEFDQFMADRDRRGPEPRPEGDRPASPWPQG